MFFSYPLAQALDRPTHHVAHEPRTGARLCAWTSHGKGSVARRRQRVADNCAITCGAWSASAPASIAAGGTDPSRRRRRGQRAIDQLPGLALRRLMPGLSPPLHLPLLTETGSPDRTRGHTDRSAHQRLARPSAVTSLLPSCSVPRRAIAELLTLAARRECTTSRARGQARVPINGDGKGLPRGAAQRLLLDLGTPEGRGAVPADLDRRRERRADAIRALDYR